jgi:sigma-B regulation protein RsbU (phosphoserine phosphatase)
MYLGFVAELNYTDLECPLEPGHALLVYSDGASELENGEGAMFGGDRLADAAQAAVAGSNGMQAALDSINANLVAFRGDRLPGDDITLLMVKLARDLPARIPSRPAGACASAGGSDVPAREASHSRPASR